MLKKFLEKKIAKRAQELFSAELEKGEVRRVGVRDAIEALGFKPARSGEVNEVSVSEMYEWYERDQELIQFFIDVHNKVHIHVFKNMKYIELGWENLEDIEEDPRVQIIKEEGSSDPIGHSFGSMSYYAREGIWVAKGTSQIKIKIWEETSLFFPTDLAQYAYILV